MTKQRPAYAGCTSKACNDCGGYGFADFDHVVAPTRNLSDYDMGELREQLLWLAGSPTTSAQVRHVVSELADHVRDALDYRVTGAAPWEFEQTS